MNHIGEILVVDDEKINRILLSRHLTHSGYSLTMAENGKEALDLLAKQSFDVVLLDLMMPGITGYQVLKQMQTHPEWKHIPVIIISALHDMKSVVECITLGATDYLPKPFEPALLKARLEASLARKRLHDAESANALVLRENEARVQAILTTAGEAIIIHNKEGLIESVNPAAENMFGYAASEMAEQHIRLFVPIVDNLINSLDQDATTQSIAALEVICQHKNGQSFPAELSMNKAELDNGRYLFTNFIRDITARKEAEKALKISHDHTNALYKIANSLISRYENLPDLFSTIANAVANAVPADRILIHIVDQEERKITHFIASGAGLTNVRDYTYEETSEGLIGWAINHNQATLTTREEGKTDPRINDAVRRRRKINNSGSLIVVPIQSRNQVLGAMTAINQQDQPDFTAQDMELMKAMSNHITIAVENVRLYEAEQQYTLQLQAQNEELDAFAGTVAHDLKSPLAGIIGYCGLLVGFDDQTLLKNRKELLRVVGIGRRMERIINEILLLASIRKEEIQLLPLDMKKIVANTLARLEYTVSEYQPQIIQPDSWPTALGHSAWIKEVWANYISNALKYGGSPPLIELGATLQEDGVIRFWLRDNGAGIPSEVQEQLFTPFTRFDRIRAQGQGLGLSIVHRIITKLDGQVGVDSALGKGSTFWFALPNLTMLN